MIVNDIAIEAVQLRYN